MSNRAIAINLGSADDVRIGTRFAVLHPDSAGVEIKDPDTGEVLGHVEVPKVVVKIFRVSAPACAWPVRTARSPGTPARLSPMATMLSQAAGSFGVQRPAIPDQHETLEYDDASRIGRRLDPEDSFVEVGDPVVEARGDEFDGYSDSR